MAKDLYTKVPAGKTLFREGESGADMYILESGTVEISRGGSVLAALEAGDFFGEMAILEDQPRFATATARTDVRVLRIERASFADLLRANVEIAIRIMRKLAARQRRAEQRLLEAQAELARLRAGLEAPAVAAAAAAPAEAAPAPRKAPAAAAVPAVPSAPAAAPAAPAAAAPAPARAAAVPTAIPALSLRHAASGQVFVLPPERAEFLVGRPDPVTGITPDINLGPLDSARSLSRRHAKLLREGLLLFLREEVGTANGTFVNGQRLVTGSNAPLKPGDRVRFGAIELDVVAD